MKDKINLTLIQMDVLEGNKDENISKIESLVAKSVTPKSMEHSHIICLPELCTTGFDLENYKQLAEKVPEGRTTRTFQALAEKYSVHLIASVIEEFEGAYYNCAVIIDSYGRFRKKYRKVHLFPLKPMEEADYFMSGAKVGLSNTQTIEIIDGINIGVLICFDVRYPEISRRLVLDGAEVLIYLAEFPRPRDDVWSVLLKARAIENQVFIAGVNRVGGNKKASFFGKSMIIDPFGNTMLQGSDHEEILFATLDPSQLTDAKSFIPTLDLRRPKQY
ncbi:MAG: nitrilase-related carbon-nitrogen hydrolase [Candidatus Hodarchaeales archaeon]|jgi:predicted amidohydrolase